MKKLILLIAILCFSLILSSCVTTREATWKIIPGSRLKYEEAWPIIVNVISKKYDLETIDSNIGYLRSEWKMDYHFDRPFASYERTRAVCRIESKMPLKFKIKVEKELYSLMIGKWIAKGNNEEIQKELLNELEEHLLQ